MNDDKQKYVLNLLKEREENPFSRQLAVKFTQEGVNYFLEINNENKRQHFLCCPRYVDIVTELFPALVVEEKKFVEFRNILRNHLSKCFDCVESFYINAKKLYQRHKSIYATDSENKNVDIFFENLGKWQNDRIMATLTKIKEGIKSDNYLPSNEIPLPVIFELLLNFKCLQNTKINELFVSVLSNLKQQGKFVKLTNRFMPGLLLCALHENKEIRKWAWASFQTIDCEIKVKEFKEFEFDIVMDSILQKLVKFEDKRDPDLLKYPFTKDITEFWKGLRRILSCLENSILCDHYTEFDIKQIIYGYWKTCNYNQESLLIELLKALNMLLEKLKGDFWTKYEHWKIKILDIFESSSFQYLTRVHSKKMFLLSWVKSYVISLSDSNSFIKILEKILDILMKESQKSDCDDGYRILCYDTILMIVIQTLSSKDSFTYHEFYLNYSLKSLKFKTIFDNIMGSFSHEEIKRSVQSSGMSGMKTALLNKLKEVQKKRSSKYSKRQIRMVEVPPNKVKNQWMLRVQKQKEDEARLIPNVNFLYKKILSLSCSTDSELPPKSHISHYKAVPNTFSSTEQYVQVFEPFLILECWQNLLNSRKVNVKDKMVIFMENVCMIDDFIEVSFNCERHNRDRLLENDLLHVRYEPSEKESLQYDIPLIQSLAIIKSDKLLFYLDEFSQNVRRFLFKDSKWKVDRIMSLTSIIREYAALIAIPKFSLKNQILNPKVSIVSPPSVQTIEHYRKNFHINNSQAIIVEKVLSNDSGFSLIQGPPGSGKSEMIVGLVSALKENPTVQGASLICAPSNSIIDILVKKLKAGIYDSLGNLVKVSVICLGHLDSTLDDTSLDFLAKKMMSEKRDDDKRDLLYYKGKVLEGADIICSTLIESGHEILSTANINFSTVIIDDATQATELSSLIPLKYNPKRVILIGDSNQSSPTVLSKIAKQCSYDQSLFVRIQKNYTSSVNTLKFQYRMHREISKFPNQFFYNSLIKNADHVLQKRNKPWHQNQLFSPYKFFNVDGLIKEKDAYNKPGAKIIAQACKRLIKDFSHVNFEGRIGIIIADKNQRVEIIKEITKDTLIEFEIDTVDMFRGKEKDIIILSCFCDSEEKDLGFLKGPKSLNVALTRAKSSLWIFGSEETLVPNDNWKALIDDAKNRDGCYKEVSDKTFSGVEPEENLFVVDDDSEKNYETNNQLMSLQSGLLVRFNSSVLPDPQLSPSHSRSPNRNHNEDNHHRRRGANYLGHLPSSSHRYRSYNHDKRNKRDSRDRRSELYDRIRVIERRSQSQSPIMSCDSVEEGNSGFQVFESNINEDNYNEQVIKRSLSPDDDSKHRRFKNEKKIRVRRKSCSPLKRLGYCDQEQENRSRERNILLTQDEHDRYFDRRTNFRGRGRGRRNH